MARPLRIEYPGAVHHITSRGDRQENIFEDERDRHDFLQTLAEVIQRHHWFCHAYCLMDNHYHLLIETTRANLSQGMRQLNGIYTQASNRRHKRSGHLFQGRFKSILIDKETFLLDLARHIILNPVRLHLTHSAAEWPWSSYHAMVDDRIAPLWLTLTTVRQQLQQQFSVADFSNYVAAGVGLPSIWTSLRQQIYLGDDQFVHASQQAAGRYRNAQAIPRIQRRAPAPQLETLARQFRNRDDIIISAYATGAYSYQQIAEFFGLHQATIGRIIRRHDTACANR